MKSCDVLNGGNSNPNVATAECSDLNGGFSVRCFGKDFFFPREIDLEKRSFYLPDELAVFDQIVDHLIERAEFSYQDCKSSDVNPNDTMDTSPTFKVLEEGSATLLKEESGKLAQHQKTHLEYLNAAKIRIQNKTFGVCTITGKLISPFRMAATPHATVDVGCKRK